jgi:hypothetical protein
MLFLRTRTHVCIYICMYACTYTDLLQMYNVRSHIHVYIRVSMCECRLRSSVYMYAMCTYIHLYIYIRTHIHIYIYIYIYTLLYVYMYDTVIVYMRACMYPAYACMCVCIYNIRICTHIFSVQCVHACMYVTCMWARARMYSAYVYNTHPEHRHARLLYNIRICACMYVQCTLA